MGCITNVVVSISTVNPIVLVGPFILETSSQSGLFAKIMGLKDKRL